MTPIDILLLIIDFSFSAFSNIVLKFSVSQNTKVRKYGLILVGLGIYFAMSFITVYLYSKYNLILIQTLLTLTYVLTPVFAYFAFKERVTRKFWYALGFIVFGIIIVSYGNSIK